MEIVNYQIDDLNEIYQVLNVSEILYLAVNREGYPHMYSVLFGVEKRDGQIILYFMDDKKNEKEKALEKNPQVAIRTEVVYEYYEYPETALSSSYECVYGHGTCTLANNEFSHAMDLILLHYGFEGYWVDPVVRETKNIYKIVLDEAAGKRHVKTPRK